MIAGALLMLFPVLFGQIDEIMSSRTGLVLDYNTQVVLTGTSLLGAAAGMIGVFLLLRKRALVGDAIAHATLPGIATAFLVATWLGGDGKSLGWLLLGATISGLLGAGTIVLLRTTTPIKEDAALGIVLSVFFGIGIVLLRIIQQLPTGYAAGLEGFIYGKAAAMIASDAWLIAACGGIIVLIVLLFRKQLTLLCFDESLARSQGWPTTLLDLGLMAAATGVVIVGIQAVGMILIIALLIIPPAAARFWTRRMFSMTIVSSAIGVASSLIGTIVSVSLPRVPSGAAIVLAGVLIFSVSALWGPYSGIWWRLVRTWKQRVDSDREHLLRSIYELLELQGNAPKTPNQPSSAVFNINDVPIFHDINLNRFNAAIQALVRQGKLVQREKDQWLLTAGGIQQAARAVRQHRLLEQYFYRIADLSPAAIDRGADYCEHALTDEMLADLERDSSGIAEPSQIPSSLHPLESSRFTKGKQ